MKRLYTYFISALVALSSVVSQAQGVASNWVEISKNRTIIKGDKLYVDFDILLNADHIRSRDRLILTPILQNDQISESLPEVILNGRDGDILYRRMIDSKKEHIAPYAVVKLKKRQQKTINYQIELPIREWMIGSKLWIQDDMISCVALNRNVGRQKVSNVITFDPSSLPLALSWAWPESHFDSLSLKVVFPENVTTIKPDYMNNEQALDQINALLGQHNNMVTGIKIIGAASPEGPYNLNEQLSESRAKAMAAFLENNYNIMPRSEHLSWIGGDWASLSTIIAKSNIANKDQIMRVIQNISDPSRREQELEKLNGGKSYAYMLENIYPLLRRAFCTIYYRTDAMGLIKARELIVSDPGCLSFEDMMSVAHSYREGSAEFNAVILLAVKSYPDNDIANLNASSVMLEQGNIDGAKTYLQKIANWPDSYNNIGVMNLLQGNYDQALEYLNKAVDNHNAQAIHNLETIKTLYSK